ncbi:MAG TPA: hypothetical protein IAB35_06660 [Candidatus Faecimonas gallistercoris]|nr:hypothetical protein [Candidatus Faecimonas gallistercoris]
MNGLVEFLTTGEMIVVYSLIGIASVLYLIIYFFDKTYYKRKQRQNTRELRKIVEEIAPEEEIVENKVEEQAEPVLIPIEKEEKKNSTVEVISTPEVPSEPVIDLNQSVETLKVEEKVEDSPIQEQSEVNNIETLEVDTNSQSSNTSTVDSQEDLQYTSIEPDPTEAQAELMKLTETLEKAEEEVKNIELTAFEEEQEQNAIISLDELMTRGKAMYESGELEKLEDEGNEPISIQDLEKRMQEETSKNTTVSMEEPVLTDIQPITEQMVLDDFQTASVQDLKPTPEVCKSEERPVYQEHKKFKSSPVISPVFGIEKPSVNTTSDIELENTANYDKLDEEIRKTNEFLMTLKELQKNLD